MEVFYSELENKTVFVYEIFQDISVRVQENFNSDMQKQGHHAIPWEDFTDNYRYVGRLII